MFKGLILLCVAEVLLQNYQEKEVTNIPPESWLLPANLHAAPFEPGSSFDTEAFKCCCRASHKLFIRAVQGSLN